MNSIGFGALDGVRVIDFTQMLAGPYCTQILADHGADVIKIEPVAGDSSRSTGPFHADDHLDLFGGYYASVNRNKRGMALDLKKPEAREVVRKLLATADVVVENYRAGVMERLGLSYESIRKSIRDWCMRRFAGSVIREPGAAPTWTGRHLMSSRRPWEG